MPSTATDRLYGLTTSVAVKAPVQISADSNVVMFGEQTITSTTFTGTRTVTTTKGMRILLTGQASPIDNGIWEAMPASWKRSPDFDGSRDAVNGTLVFSVDGDCWQTVASDPVHIGYDPINFRSTYPFNSDPSIWQRTLRVPEAFVRELPDVASRANKVLGFNNLGNPVALLPASGSAEDIMLQLASTQGAGYIGTASGNTVQQELDSLRIVANVRDPKFAGGAKGNWNETAQTGNDDTAAFQAAINYLASLPDRREGGARVLYVPEGMYMTKGLIVPSEFHFGFNMIGAGRDATLIYCNPSSPTTTPGLFIKSELSYIDSLSMFGSSISSAIDTTKYVTDLIRVQLDTNKADCDLVCGEGVQLGNAMNCITLYGRGFVFKGVGVLFTNFLNIVASSSLVWDSSSAINSNTTGMRNYMVNGCRFDQGVALVVVTGDGVAATPINGLRLIGNDVLGVASIISAATATLYGLMINSNSMYDSGNQDVVSALNVVACTINANVISKKIAMEVAPTVVNECLPRIVRSGNNIIGLNISNNEFGPIRDTVVSSVNAASRVKIIANTFHQAFALSGGAVFSGVNCSGLKIAYNDFTGSLGGTLLMWSPVLQTSIATASHNISNAGNIQQSRNYTPLVNKGGAAVTPTASACYYDYDGSYCTARYALVIPLSGVGGTINVSVPMTPIADFNNVTSTISGGGIVNWMVGGAYSAVARVLQTGFVNFIVSSTAAAMAGTDVPTTLQIEFEVKYRA